MGEHSSDSKPYDGAFKTLMRYCTELLVALVNYAFGEQFDLDATVTFMQSEVFANDADGERHSRTADTIFRLADHTYHMECQSYGDTTMQVRLVETGFGVALRERRMEPGLIETEYPRQAVLYLTCPKNTPDAVTMRLKLPTGETSEWSIPTIKFSELGLDEIFERSLYALLPFCFFWYGREGLRKCDSDESRLAELKTMLDDVRSRLSKAFDDGRISDFNLHALLDAMQYVSKRLADGLDNVREAVSEMMGEYPMTSDGLIEFPTIRRLREATEKAREEGRDEGRREGRSEGILSTLFGLVRGGHLGADIASAQAGLSLKAFNAKMAEYEARPQA